MQRLIYKEELAAGRIAPTNEVMRDYTTMPYSCGVDRSKKKSNKNTTEDKNGKSKENKKSA